MLGLILGVLTTYSGGMFNSELEYRTTASYASCMGVVDSVIVQMQREPRALAEWAFAGLGEQKEQKKNAVMLEWKDGEYVAERKYARVVFDIRTNGKVRYRDLVMESVVTDTTTELGRDVRVDIYYSGSVLKEAYGYFHVIPTDSGTIMQMDTHVRFGWFFNLFISQRMYSQVIDWRMERFVQNLCLMAQGIRPSDAYWEQKQKEKQ